MIFLSGRVDHGVELEDLVSGFAELRAIMPDSFTWREEETPAWPVSVSFGPRFLFLAPTFCSSIALLALLIVILVISLSVRAVVPRPAIHDGDRAVLVILRLELGVERVGVGGVGGVGGMGGVGGVHNVQVR